MEYTPTMWVLVVVLSCKTQILDLYVSIPRPLVRLHYNRLTQIVTLLISLVRFKLKSMLTFVNTLYLNL